MTYNIEFSRIAELWHGLDDLSLAILIATAEFETPVEEDEIIERCKSYGFPVMTDAELSQWLKNWKAKHIHLF